MYREDSPDLTVTEVEFNKMKLSDTDRQNDAIKVQRAFASTKKVRGFSRFVIVTLLQWLCLWDIT